MFASAYCFIALYSVDVCRCCKFICGCKLVCFVGFHHKIMNFMVILNRTSLYLSDETHANSPKFTPAVVDDIDQRPVNGSGASCFFSFA